MSQADNSLTKLVLQYEDTFRTAPSTAAAKVIPYTTWNLGRDPRRQKNETVTDSPLAAKTDAGNPVVPPGPMTSVLDLRTLGYLLKLLLGQPVTTGTTLKTHTFPVNKAIRPSALMEMWHSDISKAYRLLGVKCNKLSWDIMNNDQNIAAELLAAYEVDPVPTSAFDAAPTSVASFRANSGSGVISNGVDGALGQIVSGSIEINNNITPYEVADGTPGYGLMQQGELMFSGTIRAVFDGASAYELARNGTSTRMSLVSAATIGADTFDLTVDMPYVELMEKAVPKQGRSGLFVDLAWKAHSGATLPTVVLRNDVAAF